MVLAHCVAFPGEHDLPAGWRSVRVASVECYFAERGEPVKELQAEAVAFFKANQRLFAQADILEFRFPTILNDVAELEQFLQANAGQLAAELARLRGLAQVAVYPEKVFASPKTGSGTEYLRAKSEQEKLRLGRLRELTAIGGGVVRDSLDQHDRILLLVPRADATALMTMLKVSYLVAGPFPPSSFAKLQDAI